LNYAIGRQTDLFVNYRYFRANEPNFNFVPVIGRTVSGDDLVKHTATIGLRYHFGAPAAEPAVAPPPPAPPPAPEPAAPREFIVFFGHNKSNLTAEAQNVIREAAAAAKQFGAATITVVGHADRSGSDGYNQKLSLRRANNVKGALVTEGIPEGSITVSGRGETEPMVQTADGVREPQNRRVHISL
jgi:outer membrane protein OmpA-like peptidoglycan-associated protein